MTNQGHIAMQQLTNLFMFMWTAPRARYMLFFGLATHILLAYLAGLYLFKLFQAIQIDSSGGLQFIASLFLGIPMTILSIVFYASFLFFIFIFWSKHKPIEYIDIGHSFLGWMQLILLACLALDAFYIFIIYPNSIWTLFILLHLQV